MSTDIIFAEDIVMIGDIAAKYGIPKSTVQNWMRRKDFPKPVAELKAGAVYNLSAVRAWRIEVITKMREQVAAAAEAAL